MNKFWDVRAAGEEATLYLYGEIGDEADWLDEGMITPRAFAAEITKLGGKPLTVRVNSDGGSVFAALAIRHVLMDYAGSVTIKIDGVAASAATLITCVGRCMMRRGALMLIHDPTVGLSGNYDGLELQKVAMSLEAVRDSIVAVYKEKSPKLSEEEIRRMMESETWLTADEALEYGLIDGIYTEESKPMNDKLIYSLLKRAEAMNVGARKETKEIRARFEELSAKNEALMKENELLRAEKEAREELYAMIRSQLESGASGVRPMAEKSAAEKRAAAIAEVVRYANDGKERQK